MTWKRSVEPGEPWLVCQAALTFTCLLRRVETGSSDILFAISNGIIHKVSL